MKKKCTLNLSQNSSRGNEELSSGLIHKTAINIYSSSITDDHKTFGKEVVVSDIVK
jgi:hypothetical protein